MVEIVMPRLSDTMDSGVLSRWLKKVGDEIQKGDVIAEIETDKATMDLEAFDAGVLETLLVEEGASVPIGQAVAVIGDGSGKSDGGGGGSSAAKTDDGKTDDGKTDDGKTDDGGAASDAETTESAAAEGVTEQEASAEQEASTEQEQSAGQGKKSGEPSGEQSQKRSATESGNERPRTSPLARKIAREHEIDLATLSGSGPGGRIVRADIEDAIRSSEGLSKGEAATDTKAEEGHAATRPDRTAARGQGAAGAPATPVEAGPGDEEIALNNIRKITAKRLTESQAAPHFFLTTVVEVEKLLAFRADVNAGLAQGTGPDADGSGRASKISVTDLIVRAAAVTLRAHPEVNSSWGNDSIIRRGSVNVGIAVALEDGLIVPVVHDADRKTLSEISAEAASLAERARAGRLKPDEFSGGTFTISNLGMFGIDQFTAVINPPEAAILAVGAASQEPVVRDGELMTVPKMKITLTSDHRVLDGAKSAAFLRDLTRALENPLSIVV